MSHRNQSWLVAYDLIIGSKSVLEKLKTLLNPTNDMYILLLLVLGNPGYAIPREAINACFSNISIDKPIGTGIAQ